MTITKEMLELADELHEFCAAAPHNYPGHNIKLFERAEAALRQAAAPQGREALEELTTHFIVRDGPNKDKNQYGHLELWWAGKSVREEGSALYNPWMLLGSAENSYSLAAMGHLRGVLKQAEAALAQPGEDKR